MVAPGDVLAYLALGLVSRPELEAELKATERELEHRVRHGVQAGSADELRRWIADRRAVLDHDVTDLRRTLHDRMRASVAAAPNREVADSIDPTVVLRAGSHPTSGLRAVVVACRSCGRWLAVHPQVANMRHCSYNCFRFDRSARERERRRQKRTLGLPPLWRCWHCGQAFDAKRSDARYCSGRCRTAASRAR